MTIAENSRRKYGEKQQAERIVAEASP